jgi:uncharacterized membrane protein
VLDLRPKAEVRRPKTLSPKVYNIPVLTTKSEQDAARRQHRHAVYASETTGLLVIACLLLILTLLRYWHEIHWSLR